MTEPNTLLNQHPPVDPETVIWRYVDVGVATSMFAQQNLSLRQLASMDDEAEGQVRYGFDKSKEAKAYQVVEGHLIEREGTIHDGSRLERVVDCLLGRAEPHAEDANIIEAAMEDRWRWDFYDRTHLFASCWHVNEHPNHLMWAAYGRAIALKTTVRKLRGAVGKSCDSQFEGVVARPIIYCDPKSGDLDYKSLFGPRLANRWWTGLVKDGMYRSEQEMRLLAYDPTATAARADHYRAVSFSSVDGLVDEVLFHPYAPQFLLDALQKVLDLTESGVEITRAEATGVQRK